MAQGFGDQAARGFVIENRHVAHLQAEVVSADEGRGIGGFPTAHGGDFLGTQLLGTAVARCKGGDGERVAEAGQQRHGAAGKKLDVVGMRVDCEDGYHVCS